MPLSVRSTGAVDGVLALLRSARRGLLVVGELGNPEDAVAARRIGAALGWPVVTDVLSGERPAPLPDQAAAEQTCRSCQEHRCRIPYTPIPIYPISLHPIPLKR